MFTHKPWGPLASMLFSCVLMFVLISTFSSQAFAQRNKKGGSGKFGFKVGMSQAFVSGASLTLEDPGANIYTNTDSMAGNIVFAELLFMGKLGLEVNFSLTPLIRNFEILETAGTSISAQEKTTVSMGGMNIYFNAPIGGFIFFFGLGTGTYSVKHDYIGGTLGTDSSKVTIPINTMKLGADWVTKGGGLRLQYLINTGKATTQTNASLWKVTSDYTAGLFAVSIFALF